MSYYHKYQKYKSKYLNLKGGNEKCIECLNSQVNNIVQDINFLKNSIERNFLDIDELIDDNIIDDKVMKEGIRNFYGFLTSEFILYQYNLILNKKTGINFGFTELYINNIDYYDNIDEMMYDMYDINEYFKTDKHFYDYNFDFTVIVNYLIDNLKSQKKTYKIHEEKEINTFINALNTLDNLLDHFDKKDISDNKICIKNKYINYNDFIINDIKQDDKISNYCQTEGKQLPYRKIMIYKNEHLKKFINYYKMKRSITNIDLDKNFELLVYLNNHFLDFFKKYSQYLIQNKLFMEKKSSTNTIINLSKSIINKYKNKDLGKYYLDIIQIIRILEIKNKNLINLGAALTELNELQKYDFLKSNNRASIMPFYIIEYRSYYDIIKDASEIMEKLNNDFDMKREMEKINNIYSSKLKQFAADSDNKNGFYDVADYYIVLLLTKFNVELFRANYSKSNNKSPINIIEQYVENNLVQPIETKINEVSQFKIYDVAVPGHGVLLIKLKNDFIYFDSNYITYEYIYDYLKNIFGNKFKLLSPKLSISYGIQPRNEGFSDLLETTCYIQRGLSPLRGIVGFCVSWSQYMKLLISINYLKINSFEDLIELSRFIIVNNPYEHKLSNSDEIRTFNQRKLFKSMLIELYILNKNNVVDSSILGKIFNQKEMEYISKIFTNINKNLMKFKGNNIYNILS